MSSLGAIADSPTVENLLRLSDEQFFQLVVEQEPLAEDLSSPKADFDNKSLDERCLLFALKTQKSWIKKGIAERTDQLLPTNVAAWSRTMTVALSANVVSEFTTQLEQISAELNQLLSQAPQSLKKRREFVSGYLKHIQETLAGERATFPQVTAYDLLLGVELMLKTCRLWTPGEFWSLWRWLAGQFVCYKSERETYIGTEATAAQVLLVEGELAWLGGLLFKELAGFSELRKSGKQVLKQGLKDQVDFDGTPHAMVLEGLADWIAPVIRSVLWGELFGKSLWKKKQEQLYDSLLETVAQYCRTSGSFAFATGSESFHAEMIHGAMQRSGFVSRSQSMKYLAHIAASSSKEEVNGVVQSRKWGRVKKAISSQSDWSNTASLRTNWALDADSILATHHEGKNQLEMSILGQTLLSGEWDVDLKVRGRKRNVTDEWSCSCWFSDRGVDYLELQMTISDALQIDRQIVLSRKDRFALMMESVSDSEGNKLELTSRLPMWPEVIATADLQTREVRLDSEPHSVRLFPLTLPQFRTQKGTGEFTLEDQKLVQHQTGQGAVMNALFLDWHPRRSRGMAEWQTLSVTENRRTVEANEAFAARVRLRNRQWLFYRALKKGWEWPRAVLGLHTNYETVLGKFDTKGNIEPLVNVE